MAALGIVRESNYDGKDAKIDSRQDRRHLPSRVVHAFVASAIAFALERRNTRSSEAEMTLVSSSSNHVVFLTSRGGLLRKPLAAPAGQGWEELAPPSRGPGAPVSDNARRFRAASR